MMGSLLGASVSVNAAQTLGFDYLRSRTAVRSEQVVTKREPFFGIIDEVDSILIDIASMPLILTEPR